MSGRKNRSNQPTITMNITRLDRSLRKNLRDLLQGYVEHCEVSLHLMARMDFPIYYHGFKFGAPVFTHIGPSEPQGERQVLGLIGLNDPTSQVPSDVLLQFIEILTQQPRMANDSVLRILPVANPVALELEQDAPATEEWAILQHLIGQFNEQAVDGILEVTSSDGEQYALEGNATPSLFAALEDVRASLPQDSERFRVRHPDHIALTPVASSDRWHLRLTIPRAWTDAPEVHAIARFIARLITTHSWRSRPRKEQRSRF
jgi:hypothetical protein